MAVTGFVGFEQTVVFGEEARDPRRTVPRATYLAVGLTAALYAFAAWAMISAAGADPGGGAGAEGPDLYFNVASKTLGSFALHRITPPLRLPKLIAARICR